MKVQKHGLWNQTILALNPDLLLTCCVTLGEINNPSELSRRGMVSIVIALKWRMSPKILGCMRWQLKKVLLLLVDFHVVIIKSIMLNSIWTFVFYLSTPIGSLFQIIKKKRGPTWDKESRIEDFGDGWGEIWTLFSVWEKEGWWTEKNIFESSRGPEKTDLSMGLRDEGNWHGEKYGLLSILQRARENYLTVWEQFCWCVDS